MLGGRAAEAETGAVPSHPTPNKPRNHVERRRIGVMERIIPKQDAARSRRFRNRSRPRHVFWRKTRKNRGIFPGISASREESCLSSPDSVRSTPCSASGSRLAPKQLAAKTPKWPEKRLFLPIWGYFSRKMAQKYGIAQIPGLFLNGTSRGDTNSSRTLTQAQPWTSNRSNKSST